ncbi:hypothetical protein PT144_05850 (plasmid) [Borreliella garinii]|nr:hypothetical protein PT144_05850 [Borreliella garinii]
MKILKEIGKLLSILFFSTFLESLKTYVKIKKYLLCLQFLNSVIKPLYLILSKYSSLKYGQIIAKLKSSSTR